MLVGAAGLFDPVADHLADVAALVGGEGVAEEVGGAVGTVVQQQEISVFEDVFAESQ